VRGRGRRLIPVSAKSAPRKTSPAQQQSMLASATARAVSHGSNARKLARYLERVRWMVGTGFWIHFPETDRFVEVLSYQQAKYSPTGRDRLIPCLMIYGRELYEATEAEYQAFMSANPAGLDRLDCNPARDADRRSRGILPRAPSEGIRQPDAYAVLRDDRIRRTG
jgi:hypothetical protein